MLCLPVLEEFESTIILCLYIPVTKKKNISHKIYVKITLSCFEFDDNDENRQIL